MILGETRENAPQGFVRASSNSLKEAFRWKGMVSFMKKYMFLLLLLVGALLAFTACAEEEPTPEVPVLKLTFMVDDTVYAEHVYQTNGGIGAPKAAPTKEGYTFNGWYYDKGKWEQPLDITLLNREFHTGEFTLYARFEPFTFALNEDKVSYTIVDAYPTAIGAVTVPSRYMDKPVTAIADGVFEDNTSLTSITIPDSITSIGARAFKGCTALKSVMLPSGVTSLGKEVFLGCTSLKEAHLGATLKMVPTSAFENCIALKKVTMPRYVSLIAPNAFKGCAVLSDMQLPATLTTIQDSAFEGCASIVSVYFPASVQTVGNRAFASCTSLVNVRFAESKSKLMALGSYAFADTPLSELVLPENSTAYNVHLYENVFCDSNLTSISLGNQIMKIDASAFAGLPENATVTFRGTVAEFDALFKDENWSLGRTVTIVCSDGNILP